MSTRIPATSASAVAVANRSTIRPSPHGLLRLQAMAGNRAVASLMVQRKAACGCGCGGAVGCGGAEPGQADVEVPVQRRTLPKPASPARHATRPTARVVQRADLNVFGSGYTQPAAMQSDAAQIKGSQQPSAGNEWFPASEDFKVTAAGGPGAATFATLLSSLAAQGVGTVNTLRMIGHATSSGGGVLALTGQIDPPPNSNVLFNGPDDVSPSTVAAKLPAITAVRDRLASGAKIILVGCNAGSADTLMQALADAFKVCVSGFSDEVNWCLSFNSAKTKITQRGQTNSLVPNDPLGGRTACGAVGSLLPDKTTCPTPKPKPPDKLCVPVGDLIGAGPVSTPFLDEQGGGLLESLQRLMLGGQSDLIGLRVGDGLNFGTFDRRDRVRHLQQALNDAGASLSTDGMFGNGTRVALNEFQAQQGLEPGAEVDQGTADSLESGAVPGQSVLVGLRRGDGLDFGTEGRKPRVARLQAKLSEKSQPCAVDGMFGPKTGRALTSFQATRSLPTQELVDEPTAAALEDGAGPPRVCPLGTIDIGSDVPA